MLNSIFGGPYQDYLNWLLPLVILDIILKGFSLWKAARHGQKAWFIGLLLINTLGILPIIYLLFFEKKKKNTKS